MRHETAVRALIVVVVQLVLWLGGFALAWWLS